MLISAPGHIPLRIQGYGRVVLPLRRDCLYPFAVVYWVQKGRNAMLFIEYPPCSTCQKAKKWLDANGIAYTARHIKEENPTYDELKQWYEASGLPLKKFFNTSGLLYKSLNLKDRLPDMTEEEQLRLLATDGMLVKRPLVITDSTILTGFREKEWEEKLK